ncbi:hypothetical protein [Planctomicrobium sp. SH664]|uniref:hypothetical protein n=1 Tax=Planctomicrobium sp. SH664 TaxID=3448125 RepID=UPI003F5C73E6
MSGSSGNRNRELLGPLLATIIVLFYGGVATAIVLAAGGSDPVIGLLIFFGLSGVTLVVAYLLQAFGSVPMHPLAWFKRRKADPLAVYNPEPRQRAPRETYGTNRPPSVEEVRDAKDSPRNWIPANTHRGTNPRTRRRD